MTGSTFRRCPCRDDDGRPLRQDIRCALFAPAKGHGSWYYRLDVGRTQDGRRAEERKGGFRTQKEAAQKLAEKVAEVTRGEHRDDGRLTVGEWLNSWLVDKVADGMRPTTERSYRAHIREHLIPRLGRYRLSELRPAHVDALLRELRAAGKGATTIRRVHATLRSALATAKRRRLVSYNAAEDVDLPAVPRSRVKPWEVTELAAFLDAVAGHRLGALYELMAFTGLRRGEACALRWSDIDLERSVLHVRRQLVQVGHQLIEGPPKTHSGEDRRVDLGERAVGVLLAHRLEQDAERAAWGDAYAGGGLVFAREDGTRLHPELVTKTFARLARQAGVRPVRLHDLRHGQASLMLAAGVDMAVVSKRLGHSSITLTSDLYSHLLEGVGRAAANAGEGMVPRAQRPDAPILRPSAAGDDAPGSPAWADPQVRDGAPSGTRTPNPLIKSQLLCQLS